LKSPLPQGRGSAPVTRKSDLGGSNVGAVDFSANGTLKEIDRNDEAVVSAVADQDSFDIRERAGMEANTLANVQERVRAAERAGANNSLDAFDLAGSDGRGLGAETDDVFNERRREDGEALTPIDFTEEITGK